MQAIICRPSWGIQGGHGTPFVSVFVTALNPFIPSKWTFKTIIIRSSLARQCCQQHFWFWPHLTYIFIIIIYGIPLWSICCQFILSCAQLMAVKSPRFWVAKSTSIVLDQVVGTWSSNRMLPMFRRAEDCSK